jgi:hypothetical protein
MSDMALRQAAAAVSTKARNGGVAYQSEITPLRAKLPLTKPAASVEMGSQETSDQFAQMST